METIRFRIAEILQWLRALVIISEDPGSILSTVAESHLDFRGTAHLSWLSWAPRVYIGHRHKSRQNAHTQNFFKEHGKAESFISYETGPRWKYCCDDPKLNLRVNLSRFCRLRTMFNSMFYVALNVNALFTMDPNTTKKSFCPS